MLKPTIYHIALGSNKDDKFKNLQLAVDAIYKDIGNITLISQVYKSPAFGFKSDDFFNCCLVLESYLEAQKVLETLLEIENSLGRTRTKNNTYEARTIDLDIVFAEDNIINTKRLQVPHPEMSKRKFVLLPLNDVASKIKHPKFNKEVSMLLEECKDDSVLEPIKIWLKNPSKQHDFSKYNYIAIEGNIGAGKTSLSKMMSDEFNAKIVLERFADNPFLPKFYEDKERFAFPLEMSFLADRYQQLSDDLAQLDLFKNLIVSDYYIFKSLIFAQITLQKDEYLLYRKMFDLMYKEIRKPDLYVYLYQNTDRLLQNIKKRGREYEQNIEAAYLQKIHDGYKNFISTQQELNILIIDVSEIDFVNNTEDYSYILNKIKNT